MRARILLAAAMVFVVAPAFAADSTTISISPAVAYVGQLLLAIFGSTVTVATPFVAARLYKLLGIKFTDAQWAVVDRTAEHWAAQLWAAADTSISTKQFDVGNSTVAEYAQYALKDIPEISREFGLTPKTMAQFVTAHLGKMQATSGAVAPASVAAVKGAP